MNVCIIPARGGSKRIPKKNIRDFLGKPMLAYSIQAAIQSGLFQRIIVSTDSEEIADIAKQYGAEVPFMRPAELADDHAGTDAVMTHALKYCQTHGCDPKFACCIYATAPFIRVVDLVKGLDLLETTSAGRALAVTSFPFPVLRGQRISDDGLLEMQWPEYRMARSQDLEESYHDAGQFCCLRVGTFLNNPDRSYSAAPVVIPRHLVQDIDTEEDWKRAELMYKALYP